MNPVPPGWRKNCVPPLDRIWMLNSSGAAAVFMILPWTEKLFFPKRERDVFLDPEK